MNESETPGQQQNREMIRLSLAFYPLLFLLILFYISYLSGGIPAFSLNAISQPYEGEQATASMVLAVLALAYVPIYFFFLMPRFLAPAPNEIVVLVMPETISIAGFIIGILNRNPWAAIPFLALGFGCYVYAYLKVREL